MDASNGNGRQASRLPSLIKKGDDALLPVLRCNACPGAVSLPPCTQHRADAFCQIELRSRHYDAILDSQKKAELHHDNPFLHAAFEAKLAYHQIAFQAERVTRDVTFRGSPSGSANALLMATRSQMAQLKNLIDTLKELNQWRQEGEAFGEDVELPQLVTEMRQQIANLLSMGVKVYELVPEANHSAIPKTLEP